MFALKGLMKAVGSPNMDCRQDGAKLDRLGAGRPICSTPPSPGSKTRMPFLLIGTDPRREAPVLNARIRKRFRAGGFPIGVVGPAARPDL